MTAQCNRFTYNCPSVNSHKNAQINATYAPLVFTKRPHTFYLDVVFGNASKTNENPHNTSKVHFSGRAGPSDYARDFLLSDNPLTDTDFCPKEVLKFSPIPTSKYCKRSNFENFTSITKYDMDLKFNNMPAWFDLWSTRLDHFVSALSEKKVESLNLDEEIKFSLHAPNDYFWLTVEVNGVNWRIYHIPFLQKLDSKYDASHEISYDSGLKRSCSVINGMINTFDDYLINLREYTKVTVANHCQTLLAADCSALPEMAIFLLPSPESGLSANYGLRVYIGQNYFTFRPVDNHTKLQDDAPIYITVNSNEALINLRENPYRYPENETDYDFHVELTEHNILIVDNAQMHSNIQFDLSNVLNFEIYGLYKSKMCGLCSKPLNTMQNYTLCMQN